MAKKPRALRDAEERAEAIYKEAYGIGQDTEETAPTDSEDDPNDPKEEAAQPGEQPSAEDGTGQEGIDESQDKPKDEEPVKDADYWRSEYDRLLNQHRTLQGKYNAEVPRLSTKVKDLSDKLEQLQSQVAQQPAQPAPHTTGDADLDGAIETLRADWGDDHVEAMKAMAKQMIDARYSDLEKRLEPIEERTQQVEKRQVESEEDRFWRDLSRRVPNWQQINSSQPFKDWLAQWDPLAGKVRNEAINEAAAQFDVDRVEAFFTTFQEQTQPQQNEPRKSTSTPEEHVSPKRGKSSQVQSAQPAYTAADFQELHRQYQRGEWRGREEEFRKLEAEVHAAVIAQS